MKHIITSFLLICFFNVYSQDDLQLADEYYSNKEFDKAYHTYTQLAKKKELIPQIHHNYLSCLYQFEENSTIEKYLKRSSKLYPKDVDINVDYYLFIKKTQSPKLAKKFFNQIEPILIQDLVTVNKAILKLKKLNLLNEDLQIINAFRNKSLQPYLFRIDVAQIFKAQGKVTDMIDELLLYSIESNVSLDEKKSFLQEFITDDIEFETLEEILIDQVQQHPKITLYIELLIWQFEQKKDFNAAFFQAKSYDKRNKLPGNKTYEVAELAFENKYYKDAIKIYDYILKNFSPGPYTFKSSTRSLQAKEILIKSSYPVDSIQIVNLIAEYQKLLNTSKDYNQNNETKKRIAELYAFYLNDNKTAIQLLNEILKTRTTKTLRNQVKISLADIYILDNQSWESELLYWQVEDEMNEQPIGHEAKLKNAKLSYYKGEFYLAKERLDILKMATSKEIANDAMFLSLFINESLTEDTNTTPLEEYAAIELKIFQNKLDESLSDLKSLSFKYLDHPVKQYVYWQKAKIFEKMNKYENQIEELEFIINNFNDGLLIDDAIFKTAEIFQFKLNQKEKAMDFYLKLMKNHPASVYIQQARKNFRELRGDNIN